MNNNKPDTISTALETWVEEMAALCKPRDIYWCDGSAEEYQRLCSELVEAGVFILRCIKLEPYKLRQEVLLDVQQIFPLPEAADYQVRVREKEREERRARAQNRDLTRFHLTIGDKVHDNLPKRHLAYFVIREAINRGAKPLDVYPAKKGWLIVPGDHDEDSLLVAAERGREAESSTSDSIRFLTADDELIKSEGKTYAVTKMWGNQTLTEVDRIIGQFSLDDVTYQPTD